MPWLDTSRGGWVVSGHSSTFFALNSLSNSACRVCVATSWDMFRTRQRLHFYPRVRSLRFSAVSATRSSALDLRAVGLSEQGAVTELLHCQDLHALLSLHLADYDLDKLRVTKGDVLPKDVVYLVPSLAKVLRHPCSSMLRSCAELIHLEESEGPITPYWDPTLRKDARHMPSCFTSSPI